METSFDTADFVQNCDEYGGLGSPRCIDYMSRFELKVDSHSLQGVNPFSPEYLTFQIELYEKISGRKLDQTQNEMTDFDLSHHANGHNPYRDITPTDAAIHLQRLLKMYRASSLPPAARVLDMGAGWGLSSEICAYIGCNVLAVDINPKFVALIQERAKRLGLSIEAATSSFDNFRAMEQFDLVSFYECLHHSVKPWELIEKVNNYLKPNGKIAIAGEPINDNWWPAWGLRLDAISVYCIRKFGWFESGWSENFICECFHRSNLTTSVLRDGDPAIGTVIVASK